MEGAIGVAEEAPVLMKRSLSRRVGAAAAGCAGGLFRGLRDFMLRGNVVDLAVAVVVGNAFTSLVAAVVSDWMTPTMGILFNPDALFENLSFSVRGSIFRYGHFLNVLLSFVLILFIVVFFVVSPMNAFMHSVFPANKTRPCPECLSDIPHKARRCKFCCSAVEPLGGVKKKVSMSAATDKPLRAQSLPIGVAVQATTTSGISRATSSISRTGSGRQQAGNKIAPAPAHMQPLPENSCLSPPPEPPKAAASSEADSIDALGTAATSTADEPYNSSLPRGPINPLFKSTSIKISALEAAADYSWMPSGSPPPDCRPSTTFAAAMAVQQAGAAAGVCGQV